MHDPTDVPKILQNTHIPTFEFYSQIIDGLIGYSKFTMNTALIINSWNSGATGIFQYKAKEILGKSFHSIFQNLISNVIRHADYRSTITISPIHEEHMSIICMTDTGAGMSEEILSRIFTPQLDLLAEPRSSNFGAGIGLLLAKNLIEKKGGKIWSKSIGLKAPSLFSHYPKWVIKTMSQQ